MIQDNPSVRVAGQFLELLFQELAAGERIETRDEAPGEHGQMRRRFFVSTDEAAKYVGSVSCARDVYIGAAARHGEDGTRKGVHRITALWGDFDAKNGHTREDRLDQLQALPYHPSILIWTGGGWHAYWQLIRPAVNPEEMDLAEMVMHRLATGLDSDPVHDRSRIMRLPGTYNFKYQEPRPVTLERCNPELRYGLDQLQEMAEALPKTAENGAGGGGKISREVLSGPIGKGERNVALASVAGSLRNRGLDVETICVVLLEVNQLRCEPPLGEQEVVRIGRSVSRYPAGNLRYRRSSARRVYRNEETS